MKASLKTTLTVVGSIVLSTLGIYAADTLQGIEGGVGSLAGVGGSSLCAKNEILMRSGEHTLCVDMYEVSPSTQCPHPEPASVQHSEDNISIRECMAISAPEMRPWRYVSLPQAQRLCAAMGKRLPTSDEWYRIALGTNPDTCVTNASGAETTGSHACVSSLGVHDAVGNVWEWIDATVQGRSFDGRILPAEGYVTSVDAHGIAITTDVHEDTLYGKDYFWTKDEGVFGMIRGGFYGGGTDAGLYTTNAAVTTNLASPGVGFRCVKDVL